ncbi:MAG: hypothetical protein HXY34_10455 [Candidatus Thorarchaeota archaeon]|nr:hypothetical protein [Candidatus Thorarchaeota archaeon]
MQIDYSFFIIWWVVPLLILLGRAAVMGYRTRKKREELRRVEEKATPLSRRL